MNGVVFQTSTMTTAHSAVSGLAVQATGAAISAEAQEHVVDDAELVVQHPVPHLGRDDGRDRPGDEDDGAHEAAAGKRGVEDERDDDAEHRLDGDRDER